MTLKLGIAISVFNKVSEVLTNVNIIRKHWIDFNNAFISVCCNDQNSIKLIEKLDIDELTMGANIPSEPKVNLRRRQFNCIKGSMEACRADYVVHWHADAFAVNVDSLLKIVEQMEKMTYVAAFRGRGLDYRNPKTIYGDCDDHFLFLSRAILDAGLLDVDPEEHVRTCNVESFLSLQLAKHRDRVWHYSTMRQNIVGTALNDPFYDDGIQHRAMNPYNIDHERGFIHAQTRELLREKLLMYDVPQELVSL